MLMKSPPKDLEAWTNAQLDELEPVWERDVGPEHYHQYMLALEKLVKPNLKRAQVIAAIKIKIGQRLPNWLIPKSCVVLRSRANAVDRQEDSAPFCLMLTAAQQRTWIASEKFGSKILK
jgi:hypothetical protein